ncbi:ATP-grasp domain-containing protein [Legionella quateirensis]|uniref:Glutathione synthetase ATP-binding domain-like n=1 Tax=Legionella quateirensis TaxID=45072 RepID=A0A378KV12_9GAMM|nr:hypothetical protein [Legionella quateirensis]KTD52998.1 putative Glutathione synthetase ATP-binding domain-like protein [Legionella quateirensis]STY17218.1 Putative Glutathione synthetase ATP-binding domain-like [Legionella quateirensis]
MTVYLFLYNVVAIKATLSQIAYDADSQFILIGSEYCLDKLSETNKSFFHKTHQVTRNFHQIDFHEVETILLSYLKDHEAGSIRLLTNEDSTQLVCAQLREKYRIPGSTTEQVLPYVNKAVSKNKLLGHIKSPEFVLFDKQAYQENNERYIQSVIDQIGFPMFIKPVDLVSSIGTYYIPDELTFRKVLECIHQEPWTFEIDQFIDGDLFHCDAVVHDNDIEFFMAGRYANPLAKFSKGSPMGSIPVKDESLFEDLKAFSHSILKCLGMFSSAFHIEIFQDKKTGELIFLEAAARTPGALVPEMYEMMFDQNLEKLHYVAQMNSIRVLGIHPTPYHAGWITFPQIKGTLVDINKPQINIKNNTTYFVTSGETLKQANSLLDSSCSVVFWDESYQNIENTFEFLKHHQLLKFNE